jgi:hypothetical protein
MSGPGNHETPTYVPADDPAALAAFQALGFRVVGRTGHQPKVRDRNGDELIVKRFL